MARRILLAGDSHPRTLNRNVDQGYFCLVIGCLRFHSVFFHNQKAATKESLMITVFITLIKLSDVMEVVENNFNSVN